MTLWRYENLEQPKPNIQFISVAGHGSNQFLLSCRETLLSETTKPAHICRLPLSLCPRKDDTLKFPSMQSVCLLRSASGSFQMWLQRFQWWAVSPSGQLVTQVSWHRPGHGVGTSWASIEFATSFSYANRSKLPPPITFPLQAKYLSTFVQLALIPAIIYRSLVHDQLPPTQ
jgi:hypothetical protein